MVLEAAAEACLADDLLLLDFSSGGAGHQFLHDIIDQADIPAADCTAGLKTEGEGEAEEEEELEWLLNKDAFPTLDTSFEIPGHSRSSSGGSGSGSWSSAAATSTVFSAARPFWVPVRPRSKGRKRTSKVLPVFPPAPEAPAAQRPEKQRCRHCEAEETPQWRAGPEGPKTLCNACGVRYNSGRLVPEYRPANSPTFSALLHSNSHRRIMEMRRSGRGRGRRSGAAPSLVAAACLDL